MKLLLFDIDGTILHTHGLGRTLIEAALAQVLGHPVDTSAISFGGKTDPQIFSELLALHGYDTPTHSSVYQDALTIYMELMRARIAQQPVHLYPGVAELIAWLHAAEGVQLALLTGNVEPMAYLKLQAVGLDAYFPFGAFGSDHADRYQLPAIAVERARTYAGHHYERDRVVIIGDTEHDILCGRSIGALSVGVCTGHYSRADLMPHAPHLLLDDLSDRDHFVMHVLGTGQR